MNKKTALLPIVYIACLFSLQIHAKSYSEEHQKVQTLFQSDEEKTAKDAVWTAPDIFKVGGIDDGSRREGYAEYVCLTLYDYGFKGKNVWVQIIDFDRLIKGNDWVKLGEKTCQ
ncbi:hypothetical protein K6Q96_08990 [Grimontia kaedaensis]|uniref:Surface antigen domain-containing protein n=1 Tax=Grimontia kaedaensis TaxID=2872157 RepID=A0ABY4WNE6_9GAMM|nr:hypothetical protein [Grimontia kaedaensis]USH01076.1 hypothetical protein K6Q96_08990 [Grimontia kaedaensis]